MTYARNLSIGLLVSVLSVTGCSQQSGTRKAETKKVAVKKEDHVPHGKGPNGGVVFDIGKYHGEFSVDHDKKEVTVLVLGSDEKTPTPVAAKELTLTTKETKTKEGKIVPPMTIKLLTKDEAGGKASRFVGSDPGLGNVADFEGTVIGEIDGKPSQGTFKE
ncbi:MAG: hypothetical protein K2X38_23695 [Gemmataceae bacterium]|nr:hypothetical protein [Gemmataceae bacterium]